MDISSHGLWSMAIFFKTRYRYWAFLIGILPDIFSFGPHFIYSIIVNGFSFGKPNINAIPSYIFDLYSLSHSFIIFLLVIGMLFILTKRLYWVLMPWGIHILIDIPSHTEKFFPTPFLFPISNYTFNGIGWGNPNFLLINYSLLVMVYFYLLFGKRLKFNRFIKKFN